MKHRHTRAQRFALTGVALAAACLWSAQALALGLGRLNVQSVLGETLKAEIDVTSITPEEASSLRLRVAPPEAYRAAGVEYNVALQGAQIVLERRADGRSFLRVSGDRAVLEPFVDVIVEATWASGRLVREYTMLFDPPATRVATPAPVTPPQASAAPAVTAPAPAPAPTAAAPAPRAAAGPAPARAAPAPATAAAPSSGPAMSGDEYRVRRGDSLSGIAARTQRPGVSLDQMLVALFRGNGDAFIGNNMNRLKAGAVLNVPSADEAKKVSASDAREVIQAQSADFAGYRQRLASGAPAAGDAPPARAATGKVQTQVDDRKSAAAATPDKLTLSQGGVKPGAVEAKASKEAEKKDASARLAELSRNVEELKRLQQGAATPAAAGAKPGTPAPAAAPAAPAAPPLAAAPAPVGKTPPAPPTVVAQAPAAPPVAPPVTPPPAPAPAAAPAPAPAPVPTPAPAAAPAAPVAAAPTPPAPPPAAAPKPAPAKADGGSEPGFLSSLMDSPLLIPGAAVLFALLAGLGVYRLRSNMRKRAGETSFLESRLQPDSFFGASGGQRVDTKDAATSGASSSVSSSYSLSQLDAIGDVDPVAEADVYLAYGRDLQAEEILKEAMRATPDRLAIRLKLLEVYAKRRDLKGFELLATQVHAVTGGTGEDWAKAQAMGQDLEPENPLYQPGGAPSPILDDGGHTVEVLDATTRPHTAAPGPEAFVPASDAASLDGGFDLDLDLDAPNSRPPKMETTQPLRNDVDFVPSDMGGLDSGDARTMPVPKTTPAAPPAPAANLDSLDFDLGDLDTSDMHPKTVAQVPKTMAMPPRGPADIPKTMAEVPTTRGEPRIQAPADVPAGDDFGEFTMPSAGMDPLDSGDPLVRKLELAEEFRQIGDTEGARDLLEEVVAKAEGALKAKAQGMLNGLG